MKRRPTPAVLRRAGSAVCVLLTLALSLGAGPAVQAGSLREQAERTAIRIAESRVEAPDRFEVLSARFDGGAADRPGSIALEEIEARGPNASGVVQVEMRLLVDGTPRGVVRASVRGRVLGPALVARNTLLRGEPIDFDDLELADSDLTRLRRPPLRSEEQVTDRVPLRTLGAGRVLTADLLEAAPVVHKGQTVELQYRRARLSVRAQAVALRDGAPGDRIPAENRVSGVVVHGTVQPDGTLLVGRSTG
jgi:flagella basal body P-ring formation protein FlgA